MWGYLIYIIPTNMSFHDLIISFDDLDLNKILYEFNKLLQFLKSTYKISLLFLVSLLASYMKLLGPFIMNLSNLWILQIYEYYDPWRTKISFVMIGTSWILNFELILKTPTYGFFPFHINPIINMFFDKSSKFIFMNSLSIMNFA